MFAFYNGAGRGCGPRGRGRGEFDPERFFHWIERLNAGERGRGGPGGGRARRMFDGGELRLVLLRMIADEPRHGYELIKAIEELTGGAYAPSPGVVYPALTMLTEMGFTAEQASEGARKKFEVTPEGAMHLEENREQVEALMARLSAVGERSGWEARMPVRRAMGNLRLVLKGRLMSGEVSESQSHEIAALIDDVAQKIERLR